MNKKETKFSDVEILMLVKGRVIYKWRICKSNKVEFEKVADAIDDIIGPDA